MVGEEGDGHDGQHRHLHIPQEVHAVLECYRPHCGDALRYFWGHDGTLQWTGNYSKMVGGGRRGQGGVVGAKSRGTA